MNDDGNDRTMSTMATPVRDSAAAAGQAPKPVLHFIDGKYTSGSGRKVFENRSPVDGSLLSLVHEAGAEEVDAAVDTFCRAWETED